MSEPRRRQTEHDRHKRAFEIYYSQGGSRSHDRVARELSVSLATVKAWSRSFGWQRRVEERDAQVAREVADRSLQSGVNETERNLKIVRVALLKLAKGIADGKVKIQMGDLDRLIRLETFLRDGSFDSKAPRTAEEVLAVLQTRWAQFSPEEQHAAMDKICPGWRDNLKGDAALRNCGPVLILPEDSEHFTCPTFVLPDNGSSPKAGREEVADPDGPSTAG